MFRERASKPPQDGAAPAGAACECWSLTQPPQRDFTLVSSRRFPQAFLPFSSDEILVDVLLQRDGSFPPPLVAPPPSPRLAAGRRQTQGGPSSCPFSCSCASSLPTRENVLAAFGFAISHLHVPPRPAVWFLLRIFGFARSPRCPVTADSAPDHAHAARVLALVISFSNILHHSLSSLTRLRRSLFAPGPHSTFLTPRSSVLPPPLSTSSQLIPPIPVLRPPIARKADRSKIVDRVPLRAVDAVERDRLLSGSRYQVHDVVTPLPAQT